MVQYDAAILGHKHGNGKSWWFSTSARESKGFTVELRNPLHYIQLETRMFCTLPFLTFEGCEGETVCASMRTSIICLSTSPQITSNNLLVNVEAVQAKGEEKDSIDHFVGIDE